MFYDQVKKLCTNKNISLSYLIKELGMSPSNATKWKEGKVPKADTLLKIAQYFNVSADYLLGLKDE